MNYTAKITPEIWKAMIDKATQGGLLKDICDVAGIDRPTLWAFLESNKLANDAFMQARDKGYDELADGLINLHETIPDPAKARIASDNRRWLLARRVANRYGDRIEMNMTGQIDLNAALLEAQKRLPSDSTHRTIDVTPDSSMTYDDSTPDVQSVADKTTLADLLE